MLHFGKLDALVCLHPALRNVKIKLLVALKMETFLLQENVVENSENVCLQTVWNPWDVRLTVPQLSTCWLQVRCQKLLVTRMD